MMMQLLLGRDDETRTRGEVPLGYKDEARISPTRAARPLGAPSAIFFVLASSNHSCSRSLAHHIPATHAGCAGGSRAPLVHKQVLFLLAAAVLAADCGLLWCAVASVAALGGWQCSLGAI